MTVFTHKNDVYVAVILSVLGGFLLIATEPHSGTANFNTSLIVYALFIAFFGLILSLDVYTSADEKQEKAYRHEKRRIYGDKYDNAYNSLVFLTKINFQKRRYVEPLMMILGLSLTVLSIIKIIYDVIHVL